MKSWKRIALTALGFGVAGLLYASVHADEQPSLAKILADPVEQRHVLEAAKRSAVIISNPCPSAQYRIVDTVSVLQAPAFDVSGGVISGAWKQVVDEEGCDAHRTLNVLAVVEGSKTLATAALLPGTTHADPVLQKDAINYAVGLGGSEANCAQGYVADTEFLRQGSADLSHPKAPWTERWTLITCTKKVIVPMQFIPDARGTRIVAGPNTAVKTFPLETKPE